MDKFTLRGKRLLIKEHKASEKGGFMIADVEGELAQLGDVIQSTIDGVKEGDQVVFNKFVPQEVMLDDEKYFILDDVDILMVKKGE